MRILYVGMKYDYGFPERGLGFEHWNFYESLSRMGHEVIYFDFMSLYKEHGRHWMNRRLREVVAADKPHLLFAVLFGDELDKAILGEISEHSSTITLNWFCDDHWRFDNFSRYWAPSFNWVVTTSKAAVIKYAGIGYRNVIKSQWACNHFLYKKLDLPLVHDVTFVGQPHGNRRQVIEYLRQSGISVQVWGNGWESGRLSQQDMIRVFNQSRINLNLSNASYSPAENGGKAPAVLRLARRLFGAAPLSDTARARIKWHVAGMRTSRRIRDSTDSTALIPPHYPSQIKGRNFEIPGCGGFLLTDRAENLEDYYDLGGEIACFDDIPDLADKIRYYLAHEEERHEIAEAGYRRTLRDHTYERRFNEIFDRIGLESGT
jgi:spore maturation protein CgeB